MCANMSDLKDTENVVLIQLPYSQVFRLLSEYNPHIAKIEAKNIGRTKESVLQRVLAPIFKSKDLGDVFEKCSIARETCQRLDLYKDLNFSIVKDKSWPVSHSIVVDGKVPGLLAGAVKGTVSRSNTYGVFSAVQLRNLSGHGDSLKLSFDLGMMNNFLAKRKWGLTNIDMSYSYPVRANPDFRISPAISTSWDKYFWNKSQEFTFGPALNLFFVPPYFSKLKNQLKLFTVWRHLSGEPNCSFDVREEFGSSIKTCLRHTLVRDSTKVDLIGIPNSGSHFACTTELAGFGGDANFLKESVQLQSYFTPVDMLTCQLSLAAGTTFLFNDSHLSLPDKFYLGGPFNVRGFDLNSMGPKSEGDALGGNSFLFGAIHLFGRLPFMKHSKSYLRDILRPHFFCTSGLVMNHDLNSSVGETIKTCQNDAKVTCGAGIALQVGRIRLELHYLWPLKCGDTDNINSGLQAGAGIDVW